MSFGTRRAGQPVMVLAAVVVAWVAMRAAVLQFTGVPPAEAEGGSLVPRPPALLASDERMQPLPLLAKMPGPFANPAEPISNGRTPGLRRDDRWTTLGSAVLPEEQLVAAIGAAASDGRVQVPSSESTAHALLWYAAMARVPMAEGVRRAIAAPLPVPVGGQAEPGSKTRRFAVDGWLFLREGGGVQGGDVAGGPAYGGSQAGAIVWWDAAPASSVDPRLYLRATAALAQNGEREAAAGASVRPFSKLPVALHAEMRATGRPGSFELRPAALVTAGMDRQQLPMGFSARGYAQAGWVGGGFATAFADGSLVAEREVARFDLGRVTAGAGVWGGAQKDADRLDIGPSASVDLEVAEVPFRISADYRVRVGGNAAPRSGAALTLSSGF